MHSSVRLFLPLFLLAACPDAGVDLSTSSSTGAADTDGASSTSAPTGLPVPGLDCIDLQTVVDSPADLDMKCKEHPFERAPGCETRAPMPTCEDVVTLLAATPACDDIDICDYYACADAMREAPCGDRPAECNEIIACLDAGVPAPAPNACCDEHGVGDQPGMCGTSTETFCVDCDWNPVLCMTEGCGSANVEDCCLSEEGETVACPPPVCSPGFCDDFEEVGLESGLDPEFAEELEKVCKWNPCFACGEVEKACAEQPCPALQQKCETEILTCDCG